VRRLDAALDSGKDTTLTGSKAASPLRSAGALQTSLTVGLQAHFCFVKSCKFTFPVKLIFLPPRYNPRSHFAMKEISRHDF
jgi:hypothetical protein